jgi:hypothetical protein
MYKTLSVSSLIPRHASFPYAVLALPQYEENGQHYTVFIHIQNSLYCL